MESFYESANTFVEGIEEFFSIEEWQNWRKN